MNAHGHDCPFAQDNVELCKIAIMRFFPTVTWKGVRLALEEEPRLVKDLPELGVQSWVQKDIAELPIDIQKCAATLSL